MLLIQNLKLPADAGPDDLKRAAAKALGVSPADILDLSLRRQSIDARKKSGVHLVCAAAASLCSKKEEAVLRRAPRGVSKLEDAPYIPPASGRSLLHPPVVVGMGPAGLFAALTLARAGQPPILLERGRPVEDRARDVERFWSGGPLSPVSNVQFGEGGAGAFSDGKLTTGVNDPRIAYILDVLVSHGAPADIKWSHKPHIGTDVLRDVVRSIRGELLKLGADIRFEHRLAGLEGTNGRLTAVTADSPAGLYRLPCEALILAPGHSARDTFQMLYEFGLPMQRKSFAVGVRIEHSQEAVSRAQFGRFWDRLPAADYKLACHLPSGLSAFTFCVCPGGQVVAAASAPGQVATNGMSFRARDGANINGGFLVGVDPDRFGGDGPLAGVRFQEKWERAAFEKGGGNFRAPVQLVGDFLAGRPSAAPRSIMPTYRPGVAWTALDGTLPDFVLNTLKEALPVFDRKLRGFAHPDAVLTGVETRSSSPVRLLRDGSFQSPALPGLYPCGEGAGYAGGITSAAVDGIKTAEAVLSG